jgi:hypothetical protein
MSFKICLIDPLIPAIFKVKILLNKAGSHLEGLCSSPDSNFKSGEEQGQSR